MSDASLYIPVRQKECFRDPKAPIEEEINSLFDKIFYDIDTSGGSLLAGIPPAGIEKKNGGMTIKIDASGAHPEEIDICAVYNFLLVSWSKKEKADSGGPAFQRILSLPEDFDSKNATAHLSGSELLIYVPAGKKSGT